MRRKLNGKEEAEEAMKKKKKWRKMRNIHCIYRKKIIMNEF